MLVELNSVIAAFTAAKDLGLALVSERDRHKAAAIQIEFTEKIVQAQANLLQVLGIATEQAEALRTARERVGELEAGQREAQRYQLVEVVAGRGIYAYRLRPASELDERRDEPVHFLCQPCFDRGIKSVLQRSLNGNSLVCSGSEAHRLSLSFSDASPVMRRG
jgi:hypothetical protein